MKDTGHRLPILGLAGFGTDAAGNFVSTAGVGKDTFSDLLVNKAGFRKLAFAEPIKYAMQHLFGLSAEETWGREDKEKPMQDWGFSPRRLARVFGTEFGREKIHPELWLEIMRRRLKNPEGHTEFGGLVGNGGEPSAEREEDGTAIQSEQTEKNVFSRVLTETAQIMLGLSKEALRHCLDYGEPAFVTSDGHPILASDVLDGLQILAAQMMYDPEFERMVSQGDFFDMLDRFATVRAGRPLLDRLPETPENSKMAAEAVHGYVVTDVRFLNEMQFIKEMGGKMAVIVRDLESAGLEIPPSLHASEVSLLPYLKGDDNLEVDNNGTLEDLARLIPDVVTWVAVEPFFNESPTMG